MQLRNNKMISFTSYNNHLEFSVALQIPVTDPKAIEELSKRMEHCAKAHPSYGDIKESPKNFHVTIKLFFPMVSQL